MAASESITYLSALVLPSKPLPAASTPSPTPASVPVLSPSPRQAQRDASHRRRWKYKQQCDRQRQRVTALVLAGRQHATALGGKLARLWQRATRRQQRDVVLLTNANNANMDTTLTHLQARCLRLAAVMARGPLTLIKPLQQAWHLVQTRIHQRRPRSAERQGEAAAIAISDQTTPATAAAAKQARKRLQWLVYAVAKLIQALLQTRRRLQYTRALAPVLARQFIQSLLAPEPLTDRMLTAFHHQRQRISAARIETAWLASQARHREARHVRQPALLTMLRTIHDHLVIQDARAELTRQVCVPFVRRQFLQTVVHGTSHRLAARLIQRVWRGYQARQRVTQLRTRQARRLARNRERRRLAEACQSLRGKSELEVAQLKAIRARTRARMAQWPRDGQRGVGSGYMNSERLPLARARRSMLEPLSTQHTPPRVSVATGANTMRVHMETFEKIRTRQARVNPRNLWVAVPVGFHPDPSPDLNLNLNLDGDLTGNLRSPDRAARAGSRLRVKYDWVPATLFPERTSSSSSSSS